MHYRIIADYHVHSDMANKKPLGIIYKHAKSSIEENANTAIKRGLKEIAITDHGFTHIYGMSKKNYPATREIIDNLNFKYRDNNIEFRILLGVEANIISSKGEIDVDEDIIEYLDLICVGYHPGSITIRNVKRNYMRTVGRVLENYDVAILNHPKYKVDIDVTELGEMASRTNTAIELNRKHDEDFTVEEIRILKEKGVIFSFGSDSHKHDAIGRFGKVTELAAKAGLTNDDIVNADGEAHNRLKLL
ncbi:MAG TPA: PHP domain-containing protein [Oscillospiraceae bacterium]|nr:PHP domain-containing protein [Oscillospiraceae bacterium]